MKNILLVLIVLFLFSFMSISFAHKMGRGGGGGAAPGSRPWWWNPPSKTTGGEGSSSGQVGLFNFFQSNRKLSEDSKVIPNSVKLPGDSDPKKWPYPRSTDSDWEKEYKREVSFIQNRHWGSFNSLEQQRRILTGELARCRLQVREMIK